MTDQEFDNAKFFKGQTLYINKGFIDINFKPYFKLIPMKLMAVDFVERTLVLSTEKGYRKFWAKDVIYERHQD